MINRLIKIRSDTNEVVSSSFCFFNEEDLEKMDITLDKPIIQNDITYTYQLIKCEDENIETIKETNPFA